MARGESSMHVPTLDHRDLKIFSYFLDPEAPGRDFGRIHQTARVPNAGVPYYQSLRDTLSSAMNGYAGSPVYGDGAYAYDPSLGFGEDSPAFWSYVRSPHAFIHGDLVKVSPIINAVSWLTPRFGLGP